MNEPLSSFVADKVSISGPKVDGSYAVKFEVGEYQTEELKKLFGLSDMNFQVNVSSYAG